MLALLKKEISSFLSTLIGYMVIIVFLTITGLFLWVFQMDFNVLQYGYSSLDSLFIVAPFVFLFLIPAITMRSFADEKKSGTLELLVTKPLSDYQIIFSKYLAGVILVLVALIPTLIYFLSVYLLGNPVGNIDVGGTWGSYIGLFFLASAFVAIGIFSSSITDNQIVSFVVALLLSGFMYIGFDFIYSLDFFGNFDLLIKKAGINEHYISLSRGVIDTRDIIYFLILNFVFISLTRLSLQSRKW